MWAVDIIGAPSALMLALLAQAEQSVRYASGRVVAAMSAAYTGEGKTDAKDAYVIAETARLRRDLTVVDRDTELVRNLALLTAHRADLVADRVRMINRLRDLMTSVFPALERAFDYASRKGALVLLTGYATPHRIRRIGADAADRMAAAAPASATPPASPLAPSPPPAPRRRCSPAKTSPPAIIAELATNILAAGRTPQAPRRPDRRHLRPSTPKPRSSSRCPASARSSAPSLLVAAGDLAAFPSAGHLAAAAGLVPVPNDSGRRTGNLHRPKRYSRPLRHVFYLVRANQHACGPGPNRDYYLKKREHGRTHTQAVIALARRRVDVLWALLRDNRTWTTSTRPHVAQAA